MFKHTDWKNFSEVQGFSDAFEMKTLQIHVPRAYHIHNLLNFSNRNQEILEKYISHFEQGYYITRVG